MRFLTARASSCPLALAFTALADDDRLSGSRPPSRFRRRRRVTCCALSPSPATSSLAKSAFASEDGDLGVKKPAVYAFVFKEEHVAQTVDASGNMNFRRRF